MSESFQVNQMLQPGSAEGDRVYLRHWGLLMQWGVPGIRGMVWRTIVDRLRNSLDLNRVLETLILDLVNLFQTDSGLFCWYYADTRRLKVIAELEPNGERPSQRGYHPLSMFDRVAQAANLIQTGDRLFCLGSVSRWSLRRWRSAGSLQISANQDHFSIWGSRSSLWLPVRDLDGVQGYLVLLAQQPRHWSRPEREFLQALGQPLTVAIHQAQLYDQTRRQAQREQLVNQITTQTRQSFDLELILNQAIAQLMEALKADRCLVHLVGDLDLAAGELQSQTTPRSISEAALRRHHLYEVCRDPFPPSIDHFDPYGPITQWVIDHRQPVVLTDVTQDDRVGPHNPEYQQAEIKSSLVLPVQAGGKLYAILYLNQCAEMRYWSDYDQQLAQAVADQLAISIQQAHLYAKTQKQATESAAQAKHLAEALQELRQTQVQLIQSEKLSSLGRMVAGLAHEINNPTCFIYGNLPYVENYFRDLLNLLQAYQAAFPEATPEIRTLQDQIELPFIQADLPQILTSMKAGSERIRAVVQSLRHFSRVDESGCKTVDLHEGLDSILCLLQNQVDDIQIIKEYGSLPLVDCYPKVLNQAFMNLLINAIEALQSWPEQLKMIIIRTQLLKPDDATQPKVQVTIADNGPGVPVEIQSKIFDPFFTTKDIGKGSGLGLALTYQAIVNQHHGQIHCRSYPGGGTEFVVEIPLRRAIRTASVSPSSVLLVP